MNLSHRLASARAPRRWRLSLVAACGALTLACQSKVSPAQGIPPATGAPAALRRPISADGEYLFRLVSHGPPGEQVTAKGTNSCCDEIRSGWMAWRGQTWVAVDTVAESRPVPNGGGEIRRDGPFAVRVDSGRLARRMTGNVATDTTLFLTMRQGPLPMAGAIGLLVRDTLRIRAAVNSDLASFEWAETRTYVRVRR